MMVAKELENRRTEIQKTVAETFEDIYILKQALLQMIEDIGKVHTMEDAEWFDDKYANIEEKLKHIRLF